MAQSIVFLPRGPRHVYPRSSNRCLQYTMYLQEYAFPCAAAEHYDGATHRASKYIHTLAEAGGSRVVIEEIL